jgi:membrane metallo-endopeptidase-like protein 1
VNGNLTLGENIADNGGIKEAYGAYQKWLTRNKQEPLLPGLGYDQNQLFFINYAQLWCSKYRSVILQLLIMLDVHSPNQFR